MLAYQGVIAMLSALQLGTCPPKNLGNELIKQSLLSPVWGLLHEPPKGGIQLQRIQGGCNQPSISIGIKPAMIKGVMTELMTWDD